MAVFFSLKVYLPPNVNDVKRHELIQTIYEDKKLQLTSPAGSERNHSAGVPIIRCDYLCLSPTPSISYENTSSRFVAVFCPSTLVDTALEQVQCQNRRPTSVDSSEHYPSPFSIVEWIDNPTRLSQVLLSLIHPFLSQNFTIQAILTTTYDYRTARQSNRRNTAGALVILNLSHCPYASILDDLLDATNCEVIRSGPEAILKNLLLCNLEFHRSRDHFDDATASEGAAKQESSMIDAQEMDDTLIEIPTCPVCLHRIEPSRLGLPRPRSHQLCSKFCPGPNLLSSNNTGVSCPRQRLLQPWPSPCYCEACHVIWSYWRKFDTFSTTVNVLGGACDGNVFCSDCGMRETLWVCLTCGFVGCGRYSNKHASEHNNKTYHPFCLELSTLRIWSYVDSEFVHRLDLLECPSSLQNMQLQPTVVSGSHSLSAMFPPSVASSGTESIHTTLLDRLEGGDHSDELSKYTMLSSSCSPNDSTMLREHSAENYERIISSSLASVDEKTPKKATMIGEEYEVLLQSALEEQAQFYEGEISWLRARLTAQHIDQNSISADEALEIENLSAQINELRVDIDRAGHALLDVQALEAGHRATSQRLLHEQTVIQELLKKIRDESAVEHEKGQEQIEELELQIADLNANQKMMQQFLQDENLKNSQIFAAEQQVSPSSKPNRKGKKFRKFFQK